MLSCLFSELENMRQEDRLEVCDPSEWHSECRHKESKTNKQAKPTLTRPRTIWCNHNSVSPSIYHGLHSLNIWTNTLRCVWNLTKETCHMLHRAEWSMHYPLQCFILARPFLLSRKVWVVGSISILQSSEGDPLFLASCLTNIGHCDTHSVDYFATQWWWPQLC